MDVDAIRSRFIQENLRYALFARDRERAIRTLHAFRLYFQWHENRIPNFEKFSILSQLARLEEAYAKEARNQNTLSRSESSAYGAAPEDSSADDDRIGHHFQETSF